MTRDIYNTPWRKMSTALYAPPNEGKVYGTLEVDITKTLVFVQQSRKNGQQITVTHCVAAALGRALFYAVPEVNAYIHRGNIVPRDDVIVSVAVNMSRGQDMSNIRIHQAHSKTVYEIGEEIRTKAAASRTGTESKTVRNKYTLSKIPWPFRRWAFLLIKFIFTELGFQLPKLGLTHDAFGSILLTNIGSHGLTTGFAALFPASKLPAVIVMGKAEDKPVVRDGKIVIRTILPVTGVFDHRFMDGFHGGKLAKAVVKYLRDPESLSTVPE